MTTGLIGIPEAVAVRARVAVVAQEDARELALLLERAGHEHCEFAQWADFRASCDAGEVWDLVLYDAKAPEEVPVDTAVPGIAIGDCAEDVGLDALTETLAPVVALAAQLQVERTRVSALESLVEGIRSGQVLAGRCPVMRRLQGTISRAACSDATVLIEGPPGSGKSLVARMIHCAGRRANHPIRVTECAAVDSGEMARLIAATNESSLVLENVEQLPSASQSVLVKHLKERSGPRASSTPRIIATTSAHLPELVAKGALREDLYYRLNGFPMVMPALREHIEDVGEIARAILQLATVDGGHGASAFTEAAITRLESLSWPGNVTQLEAVVLRAHALAAGAPIDQEHVAAAIPEPRVTSQPAKAARVEDSGPEPELTESDIRPFEVEEQDLLSRALCATKGNVRRAAQLLGIGRATLYRKIQQYKLRLQ